MRQTASEARRKWLGLTLGLMAAAASFLVLVVFRPANKEPIPSLLGHELRFDAALIEKAWQDIASHEGLAKIFSRDRVNRFFPEQAAHCRVKYDEVIFQALLAPGGSRMELELEAEKGDQLAFAIFNPQARPLEFLVKTGLAKGEKLLFRSTIQGSIGQVEKVLLRRAGGRKIRLILETRGHALGAWINPCLLRSHPRPRTVLVVVLDTLRVDHVSAYGYGRLTTPELDALARGCLLFRRAFSTTSWTLPAHVSLFSGRDVLDHGVVSPESLIPADLPLLAETMQKNGFVTLAQTGGGFVDGHYGFFRGFQSYVSRAGDIFQQEAAGLLYNSFLEDARGFPGQDLFVFLHTYQMHSPYKAPDRYFRSFNPGLDIKLQGVGSDLRSQAPSSRALSDAAAAERQKLIDLYDASILYSDQELIRPLVAYLRDSHRFAEAMIVVLSDHGEEFYDHGGWEHGHSLYQELTRIPLIVKLPRQERGEIRDQLVSISDIAGMIKAQYGLNDDAASRAGGHPGKPLRVLELSLPLSPFHSGLFGKVSFVAKDHQYIHNFMPPAAAAVDLPRQTDWNGDEWFRLPDSPAAAAEPFSPSPALHSRYRKMLADYILRLKALKKNRGKLDAELLEKLKALGYLNN